MEKSTVLLGIVLTLTGCQQILLAID
ncbi:lipoprotein [Alkalihalobacillus clausii]|nr:lipoprotein [Shouchella clausii]